MAELVDAPDSKSGSERSAGSIPARGTTRQSQPVKIGSLDRLGEEDPVFSISSASKSCVTWFNWFTPDQWDQRYPSTVLRNSHQSDTVLSLSETAVRVAKSREKQFKMADDLGLYLLVKPNGSKLWRMDYQFLAHSIFVRKRRAEASQG